MLGKNPFLRRRHPLGVHRHRSGRDRVEDRFGCQLTERQPIGRATAGSRRRVTRTAVLLVERDAGGRLCRRERGNGNREDRKNDSAKMVLDEIFIALPDP